MLISSSVSVHGQRLGRRWYVQMLNKAIQYLQHGIQGACNSVCSVEKNFLVAVGVIFSVHPVLFNAI